MKVSFDRIGRRKRGGFDLVDGDWDVALRKGVERVVQELCCGWWDVAGGNRCGRKR